MKTLLQNAPLLALIGTIIGTIGLKFLESLLSRGKTKSDTAAEIRKELREDVQALRDEIRKVETELDIWKAKYYDLLDQFYKKGIKPDESVGLHPEQPHQPPA